MANDRNDGLHAEAEALLASGVRDVLSRYGEVHPVGSFASGLMTWRDLDLHVVRQRPDIDAFFAVGADLARLSRPHRMHFATNRSRPPWACRAGCTGATARTPPARPGRP